jgi:hypothetical protein
MSCCLEKEIRKTWCNGGTQEVQVLVRGGRSTILEQYVKTRVLSTCTSMRSPAFGVLGTP